ncbi:MAG: N-terminal domain, partial [Cyanobacteria bacterium RYN_339]|nr:N-terminal domain [Cyanobacteria bacterium RYN_339]
MEDKPLFTFDPTVSSAVPVDGAPPARPSAATGPLAPAQLALMQRYWAAANFLTVGQIYLQIGRAS